MVPQLKSATPILLAVIFVLVNVGIWWAGPWLNIDGQKPLESALSRTIASTIFSLSCLGCWGLVQWRRLLKVDAQKQHAERLKVDPVRRLEERQERELNAVMLKMKESLNSRNYLYTLPWFLVMGGENAGKTSLINRSGQTFAFSSVMRASGQKSQNPYAFDWWVGDEAVLIDPDGELLTQKSGSADSDSQVERRLWLHFVGWLEKNRSRRPLNGVILTLDMADLVTAPVSERKAYAQLMRTRLRELMEMLTTRLPVYITLTKLDLMLGFEPFFRHLNQSQRDEILGFTFSLDSVSDSDRWMSEFDQEYSGFISRINACLPRALLQCRDKEERAAIYSFSRQIAGAHGVLREFFGDVLSSDQFSTSALVRGVYLTSVFQQGVPVDAYVDGAARRYGLTDSVNSAQKSENSTPYFTRSLFTRIIYPESGLASDNRRVTRQKRRLIALSALACSIATVMMVGGWHRYYLLNSAHAEAVLEKVNEYNTLIDELRYDQEAPNVIPPLDTIRAATLEFGFFRDKPRMISDLGLYQGHAIGPEVEETYLKLLSYQYLPILLRNVARAIAVAPEGSEEKLAMLRVFRMLADKSGRRDHFVRDYFTEVWQRAYQGNRTLQTQLMKHLDYALLHTDLQRARDNNDAEAIEVLAPFDSLVARTQRELSELPIEQRVYRYLKASAADALKAPLDLRLTAGPAKDLVFELPKDDQYSQAFFIPRFLTRQGLEQYLVPKSNAIAELALIDSWVLGETETTDFSSADKAALRSEIIAQYANDYHRSWVRALSAFQLKPFKDIGDAVLVLDNLSVSNKPLQRLLESLKSNTQLFPNLPEDDIARETLLQSESYRVASQIDAGFADLNQLLESDDTKPAYMDEVTEAVAQLHLYLSDIQNSPDSGKAALEAAQERFKLKDNDPIYVLERLADGLPKPLSSMMTQIAHESWKVVLHSAIKELEVRWYDEVYLDFQRNLASRYPFNLKAEKQASIRDFERFFGPEGTLNSFYDQQMRVFVEDNAQELDQLAIGDQRLIRDEVLQAIEQSREIQSAFFNLKGNLDVRFTLEPLQMSSNKRRSVINIDGQYVEYAHGPRRAIELVWPNTLREAAESKLTLVPSEVNRSPRSMAYRGPWAFFKLLDSSQITGSSGTSVDYQFSVDGGDVSYRIYARDSNNPFTARLLSRYVLPKTLY
ncbi:IcmF-related protein [Marinobacterium lacunae]|uniref:IcmF-related protein n=1 Tax=Marinobacterium lacunae TaxID=1232683 RepID=A0A081G3A8_9GAMM|nr:IcmF-related protein [Marinobacterium lacunae]